MSCYGFCTSSHKPELSVAYIFALKKKKTLKKCKNHFQLSGCTKTGHRLDLIQFTDCESLSKRHDQRYILGKWLVAVRITLRIFIIQILYLQRKHVLQTRQTKLHIFWLCIQNSITKNTVCKFLRITFSLHFMSSCWLGLAS